MAKVISNEALASVTLELSMLLHAGVGVSDALDVLSKEKDYASVLGDMPRWADDGASLAQCFKRSKRFPAYVCGLLEVGERAGRTEEALAALFRYYDSRVRLERRMRSALLYPSMMLVLMLVVIGVLLVKVLPIFDDVYASLGSQLTGVAGGLLLVGRWLDRAMPVLWVVLAVLTVFFVSFAAIGGFRAKVLDAWRSRRGDKGVQRKLNTARLVQALSMGVSSGMGMEQALELSAELLADVPDARERCLACVARLERGEALGEAMTGSELLPRSAIRFLELGQRSGAMDRALEKLAADLSEDGEYAVDAMLGRVEPALVLVCALLVGMILLSVMLPLMHILSAIG